MMFKTGSPVGPPPNWAEKLADLEQVRKILVGEEVMGDLLPTALLLRDRLNLQESALSEVQLSEVVE